MGYCVHVYKHVDAKICLHCGNPTNEVDWELHNQQHKEWIASGKAVYGGWWSI